MDILEIMKQRHSVRQYTDKEIEEEKRDILNELVKEINQESGLNIQIIYNDPKCFNSLLSHYGKFSGVNNYICLVGNKASDLDERLGYYGEKLVLKATELGLNTCWVGMTHGHSKAVINKGQKQVCLISIGYGLNEGVAHKVKAVEEVSNYTKDKPEWFLEAVKAALLAPTAVNQQKFYFELLPSGDVKLSRKNGFFSRVDLGIVKYHFELIAKEHINKII